MPKVYVEKEKKRIMKNCTAKGIDEETCKRLLDSIQRLDSETSRIWSCSDKLKNLDDGKLYDKLDKAYLKVEEGRDWIRDVVGDTGE
jgi:hypothetical protein